MAVNAKTGRYSVLAHQYVAIAIRNGDLPKLDGSVRCMDCGAPAAEYDHRDYKKPLTVDPVCRACNQARGPGLHRDPSETGKRPTNIRVRFATGERGGAHLPVARVEAIAGIHVLPPQQLNQPALIDRLAADNHAQILAQQPRLDGFAHAAEGEHAVAEAKQDHQDVPI